MYIVFTQLRLNKFCLNRRHFFKLFLQAKTTILAFGSRGFFKKWGGGQWRVTIFEAWVWIRERFVGEYRVIRIWDTLFLNLDPPLFKFWGSVWGSENRSLRSLIRLLSEMSTGFFVVRGWNQANLKNSVNQVASKQISFSAPRNTRQPML